MQLLILRLKFDKTINSHGLISIIRQLHNFPLKNWRTCNRGDLNNKLINMACIQKMDINFTPLFPEKFYETIIYPSKHRNGVG